MVVTAILGILVLIILLMGGSNSSPNKTNPSYKIQADLISTNTNNIQRLNKKTQLLQKQLELIPEKQIPVFRELLNQFVKEIEQKSMETVLHEIFGAKPEKYDRSYEFEKIERIKNDLEKTNALDVREIKQSLAEKYLEQDRKIFQVESKLFEEIGNLKIYIVEKFSRLENAFLKEIINLRELVSGLRVELKEEIGSLRLDMGKEILRIDKQQMSILDKMQQYENTIKGFSHEVKQIKTEAMAYSIRAEDVLNRANNTYQKHRTELQLLSKNMESELLKISIHKQDFANAVGSAKLSLDAKVQDVHFALKDMAYERIGINALREDYQQRVEKQELRMQNLIGQQNRIEERINEKLSRGQEVAGLRHQLFLTQEKLQHASDRANLMRQEFSMLRRLT